MVYVILYVNYVSCFVFLFLHLRVATTSGDIYLVLHQRIYNWDSHHHQLHSSAANYGILFMIEDRPRWVLCPPTGDVLPSVSGAYFLRRVLCLSTRGDDRCQEIASSRLGLFLWIVWGGGLRTFAIFNNSQLLVVPTGIRVFVTVFVFLQSLDSAARNNLNNHHPNHTHRTCVNQVSPHHLRCGATTMVYNVSVAFVFRASEQRMYPSLSNLLMLSEWRMINGLDV